MRARLVLLSACLLACDPAPVVDAGPSDAGPDSATDTGPADAGPDRGALCDALSLPRRAFDASATGTGFEETVGDFTVATLDGDWTLSEQWSGCESYVFVLHTPSEYGEGLFTSVPDAIFTEGPKNVHYFFGTWDSEGAEMRAEAYREYVEEGFDIQGLSADDLVHWRAHVHYLTEPMGDVDGGLAGFLAGAGRFQNAFAITPQQRLDPVGSLMAVGAGGFRPLMEMARFFAPYYDYVAALDERIAASDATVVSILEDETLTARTVDREVTLPSLSGFDTLEVDVELTCLLSPGDCSEWDRIAHLFVCVDSECAERRELVRWITPYSRPGRRRWLMDATPLMGLLEGGGAQTFRVVFGPDWEEATERVVSVSLRLRDQARGEVPLGAELAFTGGTFNAEYNDGRAPFVVTRPAGATRAELVTIVSGHGQEASNCAEWCDHEHAFTAAGGTAHTVRFPGQAGQPNGCAARTGEGVVPGQWGNWAPLRAGWCPGLPVAPVRHDITADLPEGVATEITYEASFAGGVPPGGTISLSTYVVFYGPG
ncbi:MAG: peptide-N-glycosidase F-related protein [Sandaracinaceae bacterium]